MLFGSDAGQQLGFIYIIPRSLFVFQTSYFFIIGMLPVTSLGIKGFSHVYSLIRRITSLLEKGYNGLVVVVAPPTGHEGIRK